jgi:hypothetical protein
MTPNSPKPLPRTLLYSLGLPAWVEPLGTHRAAPAARPASRRADRAPLWRTKRPRRKL